MNNQSARISWRLTIETLEYLARDSAVRVRAVLSEEIKHLTNVPVHVVQGAWPGTCS